MKTTWNLSLLYKSETDPKLEKDVAEIERLNAEFEKKYKPAAGTKPAFTKTPQALAAALKDWDERIEKVSGMRPLHYLHLRRSIEGENETLIGLMNRYDDRLTKAMNTILFFNLAIGKIPKERQNTFLKYPGLAEYRYKLELIFKDAQYRLTEAEERILNIKSLPGYDLWVMGVEKQLAKLTIAWKGKPMPLAEAQNKIPTASQTDRRRLQKLVSEQLATVADFAESEMVAIVLNKKSNDELRGFAKPYSATVLGYENDEQAIEKMIATITDAFPISHRFYKVKAKLLGQKRLAYEDRAAKIGTIKQTFDFDASVAITREAFGSLGSFYKETFDSYLEKGQIDAFPRKGKRGGAFCSSASNAPTFVFLNHVSTFDSLRTLAHEMGHAFHAEFSKTQPLRYQGHTISVAEVASTFFENIVFEAVTAALPEKERRIALHDHIQDDIQTIFRQIACFNFEKELHETIRTRGTLSKTEMAALLNKHMKAYLGPAFDFRPEDGYFFVSWSHIRRFFYVYSYAYGQLISRTLYARYKENPSYLKKIEQFLKAGGSKSPEQIFRDIGIDTGDPAFFKKGLENIEKDIIQLERMIK